MCTCILKGPMLSVWSYTQWERGTKSKDVSNEPETIAVCENVSSLQPVEDGNAKNLLSEKTKMKLSKECCVTTSVPLKEG